LKSQLITRYEKLQERQKSLEDLLNKKMCDDIHSIQQILDNMTKQTIEGDQNNEVRNMDEAKQSYASMLMYNSY
jgi:hypothetical protein